jgi:hypothetical protein
LTSIFLLLFPLLLLFDDLALFDDLPLFEDFELLFPLDFLLPEEFVGFGFRAVGGAGFGSFTITICGDGGLVITGGLVPINRVGIDVSSMIVGLEVFNSLVGLDVFPDALVGVRVFDIVGEEVFLNGLDGDKVPPKVGRLVCTSIVGETVSVLLVGARVTYLVGEAVFAVSVGEDVFDTFVGNAVFV